MKYPNEIAKWQNTGKETKRSKPKKTTLISLNITFLTCFLIHLEQGLHVGPTGYIASDVFAR
jgi:hypothetical protein